jgi:hypothetical protein
MLTKVVVDYPWCHKHIGESSALYTQTYANTTHVTERHLCGTRRHTRTQTLDKYTAFQANSAFITVLHCHHTVVTVAASTAVVVALTLCRLALHKAPRYSRAAVIRETINNTLKASVGRTREVCKGVAFLHYDVLCALRHCSCLTSTSCYCGLS